MVELMVVIAVIVLLLFLLMPMLSSAQEASRMSVCQSNQRQIIVATLSYTDDFAGYFPPSYWRSSYLSGYAAVWPIAYRNYLIGVLTPEGTGVVADKTLLTCPTYDTLLGANGSAFVDTKVTYTYNRNLNFMPITGPADDLATRRDEIKNPASKAIFSDGMKRSAVQIHYAFWTLGLQLPAPSGDSYINRLYSLHPQLENNLMFLDGHVAPYTLWDTDPIRMSLWDL